MTYQAQELNNVKVHCSDPWHVGLDATIHELNYGPLQLDSQIAPTRYKPQTDLLIDGIETWPKDWSVKLKLIIHSDGKADEKWLNVIHFTTGVNNGIFGARLPSLWLYKTETEKLFALYIDKNDNDGSFSSDYDGYEPYELNQEYVIQFQTEPAMLDGQNIHRSWFSIDGVIIGSFYNYPNTVEDLMVYCGDPWHYGADATINELEYGPLLGIEQGPRSYKPQVDFLVDQIQTWPKEWFVKMKVLVYDLNSSHQWNTLIHFTNDGNQEKYGDRIPALWINKQDETFVFFIDTMDSNINWQTLRHSWAGQIEFDREYEIHIRSEAVLHQGLNIHKISGSIDGVEVCSVYNYQAEALQDVNVYVGDPYYGVVNSVVKDLEYGPIN
uniref:Uncharacterized protein n=3 Tax=Clytia hemisphaerica TaxID=252671 RepID=A0A7M5XPB2_9CNID